jgi:hypothetical protein
MHVNTTTTIVENEELKLTNIRPEIRRRLNLNMQVLIYFADDFYCVADCKVGVLDTMYQHLFCFL